MSINSPTQSPSKHITVVDVYDLAASIGKDFERLIEMFGSDCLHHIMPKVISALETLEALANNNEKENEEILALKKTVERLESDKYHKRQDRLKFEMELEVVEENYKKEIDDLWSMVKRLQAENKNLSDRSSEAASPIPSGAHREDELSVLIELREQSVKQKEQIKDMQEDVDTYSCEVENLHNSIEKLIRQNEELLRKNASLQKQGRMLVEEKCEIVKRLQATEEANIKLMKLFKDATRQCKDLQQCQTDDNESTPKFTLAELREVLQEKNLLKGKLMELEEELQSLRSKIPNSCSRETNSDLFEVQDQISSELVYGPINKEPDEKLRPWMYERKDSGVRKFFRFFFKDGLSSAHRSNSPVPSMRTMSSMSSISTSATTSPRS